MDAEIELLSGEAGDLQQKIARQRQQVEQLDEMVELLRQESDLLEQEVQRGEAAWVTAKLQAEEAERSEEELKARIAELQVATRAAEAARDAAQQANTDSQVALSRATAERDRARERVAQFEADLRKRRVEAVDIAATERTARDRLTESTLAMLRATAGQAEAYREKEHREQLATTLAEKAAADRAARERVRDELHALRTGWQEKQNEAHAKELAVHDLQSKRDTIATRIREDYGIDLASVSRESGVGSQESEPSRFFRPRPRPRLPPKRTPRSRSYARSSRAGSVNMEALEELVRVEGEFNALQAQHDDLNAARNSLQQVIDAINADSRKLFTDTLTAVRGYFQELFRKLFGGGQADIILEDESDVLESGIEITARPPGKELRSLSLLSGGEKTLTAVALLLAIFRNKPSPFCILDEVDAALDEANTQRLAGVLREFLDRSQFIVVTHKKRTMAAADRLWGVTMQESGISRLLPMRFEDWPEEEPQTPRSREPASGRYCFSSSCNGVRDRAAPRRRDRSANAAGFRTPFSRTRGRPSAPLPTPRRAAGAATPADHHRGHILQQHRRHRPREEAELREDGAVGQSVRVRDGLVEEHKRQRRPDRPRQGEDRPVPDAVGKIGKIVEIPPPGPHDQRRDRDQRHGGQRRPRVIAQPRPVGQGRVVGMVARVDARPIFHVSHPTLPAV